MLQELFATPDLEEFLAGLDPDLEVLPFHILEVLPFHIFISQICQALGEVPEQIIKRSDINRTCGHQFFNGTRKPSRDKVIQLAIGMKLGYEETQKQLQIAKKSALYLKIKHDAILIHCIRWNILSSGITRSKMSPPWQTPST
ncbi:hypothetical protein KQH62_03465 [bacterium]|nr:hypothetical protein [bacterium]